MLVCKFMTVAGLECQYWELKIRAKCVRKFFWWVLLVMQAILFISGPSQCIDLFGLLPVFPLFSYTSSFIVVHYDDHFRLIQMKAASKESSAKERRRSKRKSKKKLNMMTKKML